MKKKVLFVALVLTLIFMFFGSTLVAAQPEGSVSPLDRILSLLGTKDQLIDIDGPETIAEGVGNIWQKIGDVSAGVGNYNQFIEPSPVGTPPQSITDALGKLYGAAHGKLVGTGVMGTNPNDETVNPYFILTNPSDLGAITITQVSIFKVNGDPVYQGPLLMVSPFNNRQIKGSLSHHQSVILRLSEYMWAGPEDPSESDFIDPLNWLSRDDALGQNVAVYSVEVSWVADSSGSPLTGWQRGLVRKSAEGSSELVVATESPMTQIK